MVVASDKRWPTVGVMSAGLRSRPMRCVASASAIQPSPFAAACSRFSLSVTVQPIAMQLQRMRAGCSSTAATFVSVFRAPFEAL